MEAPSLFVYGTVSLLRPGGTIRRTTSLSSPQFTFGRLSSSDCRLLFETVSKLHARIVVDQHAPYQAVLEVHGVNGLTHNGIVYEKGCHIPLENNDEIIICDRIFRWGSATALEINVDSPPPSQRRAPRQSLISAAQAITPSKPNPSTLAPASPSIFSLLSPFKSTPSPSPSASASAAPEEQDRIVGPSLPIAEEEDGEEEELMSWDEQPDEVLDGEKGDLITWDEIEEEEDLVEELERAAAAGLDTPQKEEQKEKFSMGSTPSLANRARSLRPPTSATTVRTITTDLSSSLRSARRRSMRMTIVPSSRADEWIKERDDKRREEERVLRAQLEQEQEQETPVKQRARSASPSLMASNSSSTSRRISALLLSPAGSLSSGSGAADEDGEEEESSDEEEEEGLEDYQEEEGDEYGYEPEEDREQERDEVVAIAAAIPLPESPYNAPTATPAGYQSAAPLPSTPSPSLVAQQTTQTPTYIPRYSARRHSLREKVLIRSAIKKAITPPISPAVAPVAAQVQQPELGEGEVEMKDDFAAGEEEEEDEEEDEIVPIGVRVRPEDVPLPESPAISQTPSRPLTPSFSRNTPRDSMDLVRSAEAARVSSAQKLLGAETEVESDGSESEEDSESEEESEEEGEMGEEEAGGSPSPAIRFAPATTFTPSKSPAPAPATALSTPVLQRAATVPLPETPAGALYSYTPKPATPSIGVAAPSTPRMAQTTDSPLLFASTSTTKTPRSIPLPETPECARPYAVQEATPEQEMRREMMGTPRREAFKSEMTSPVTGHRHLPTPRSALRSSTKPLLSPNARRKSARGFLAPFLPSAPPSTKRKSVVFDERLYIQEIVDIRDKTMHWDERLDGEGGKEEVLQKGREERKQGARTSLFGSPAPRTPQATIIARANTTPTTSLRKAQRNPHLSASLTSSLLSSVSPFDLPPVRQNQGTPRGASFASPSKSVSNTPRKAGRVATPAQARETAAGEPTSHTPVQGTPGSVRRKAGRVATPKQPEQKQELSASVVANRQIEIQQLLATPDAAPSSTSVAPNTTAPNTTSALIERMEALRRRSLPTLQLNFVERTPAKEHEPEVLILDDDDAEESPFASTSTNTPTRDLPIATAPTPNLSAGLRRLFAAPPAPQATPKFTGLRNLFSIPGSPAQSPQFEGVAEMLRTPAPEPTLAPTPVNSQPPTPSRVSPDEQEEAQDDEPSTGVNSVDLGSHGVGIEADILAASALKPSFIDQVSPPVSPSPKEREEEVEQVEPELEEDVVEEEEQVEEQEGQRQEEEHIETPEQPAPPVVEEEPIEEEPIVEESVTPAPRKTRAAKATTTKKTTRKTAQVVAEPEQEDSADSEPTPAPAPKRASTSKSTRGSTRSTRTAKAADSDEEFQETPAAPARRRRATKNAGSVAVEEQPEEAEVEEVVVAKPTRGRAAKAKVIAEEEVPKPAKRGRKVEPVVEVIVAPARSRRTVAAEKVAEVESSHESEAEAEQVEEKPAPVRKAAPARKGRAAKAPIVVLEDEEEDSDATPAPAPARATRGKRAVLEQSSSEDAAPSAVAPAKTTRTTRAKAVESENSAPAAPKARRAPVEKVVKEEEAPATTGRALRARR